MIENQAVDKDELNVNFFLSHILNYKRMLTITTGVFALFSISFMPCHYQTILNLGPY